MLAGVVFASGVVVYASDVVGGVALEAVASAATATDPWVAGAHKVTAPAAAVVVVSVMAWDDGVGCSGSGNPLWYDCPSFLDLPNERVFDPVPI